MPKTTTSRAAKKPKSVKTVAKRGPGRPKNPTTKTAAKKAAGAKRATKSALRRRRPVDQGTEAYGGGSTLQLDSEARKEIPVATGVVDYFPDALVAVAVVSRIGNDKHNPGEPLHWARGKGGNNSDELMRHFVERGKMDDDGTRHSAKVAWRALAMLQLEIEAARAAGLPG
jgi:hypothetical protein